MPLYSPGASTMGQRPGSLWGKSWRLGGAAAPDPSSLLIFAAFTTPPTPARQTLIDTVVKALKTAGIWAKLDALYCFAAADRQASLINWIAPGTYNCVENGSNTFIADRGFTGAAGRWLDTKFDPSIAPSPKYSQTSASAFAWSLDNVLTGGIIGNGGLAPRIYPRLVSDGTYRGIVQGTTLHVLPATDGSGLSCCTQLANASTMYKNGAVVGSYVDNAGSSIPGGNLHWSHGAGDYYVGNIAFGGLGSNLNNADNVALFDTLKAYLTGVGIIVGPGYVGPGDLVLNATAWYGLRGYSGTWAAPGTNKAINIRRASDNATLDIVIKRDGKLDVAAAAAFLAATTGFIAKFYDQSGNGRDAVQATPANQPLFLLTGLGSPACSIGLDGNNLFATATIPAVASPQSGSFVYNRTNPAATNRPTLNAGVLYLNSGEADLVTLAQSLSAFSAAAPDNAWHAIQSILNGASSGFYIDGVFSAGATTAIATATTLQVGGNNVAQLMELGAWPVAFNATQYGNLNANQRAFWGF